MARSAGLLLYRWREGRPEVFLIHPGGPFFRKREEGAWAIPKGGIDEGEAPFETACREFREETGFEPPEGPYAELGEIRQRSGKRVRAWAAEGDCDPEKLDSAFFEMEWPPRSGNKQSFPEADRAGWFDLPAAKLRLHFAQSAFVDALAKHLEVPVPEQTAPHPAKKKKKRTKRGKKKRRGGGQNEKR
jgi:predicted NUDIX family NTP pyrophosphohydrolase